MEKIGSIITVLFILIFVSGCATFQGDIPINIEKPDIVYISPQNMDGIQDSVVLPLEIPELKGVTIAGYVVEVVTEQGHEIVSYGEERYKKSGISGIFAKKEAVQVPTEIIWDGKDYAGSWVDDGPYYIRAEAWDYRNNRGKTPDIKVVVDNTPPYLELSAPYLVFSPNDDGRQDVLLIQQRQATVEDRWEGFIIDRQGKMVKQYAWKGSPRNIEWDGMTDFGDAAPDGEYSYQVTSKDRGGNTFSDVLEGIFIDRTIYPIGLTVSERAFSPNADGTKDTVTFVIDLEAGASIVDIDLSVIDEHGETMRSFAKEVAASGSVVFDGRSDNNRRLPEGGYYGKLTVTYRNGNQPSVLSDLFVLDVTPPRGSVRLSYVVFSPDGDGRKDSVTIHQSTSVETLWQGRIADVRGRIVRNYAWSEQALSFEWDGKDDQGNIVPDGSYSYTLWSVDEAGNRGSYSIPRIVVDTRATPVRVVPRGTTFSPNNDGVDDYVEFELKPTVNDGIIGWSFVIFDKEEQEVVTYDGKGSSEVPEIITWNGAAADGSVKEGAFIGQLMVEYDKGNLAVDTTAYPVVVDITPPKIEVDISPLPFSPDDDDMNDRLSIKVNVQDPSGIKSWSTRIMDPKGNLFFTIPVNRFRNNVFVWDGKAAHGELVQSASDYTLVVTAEDRVGNMALHETIIPVDILVLKDGDRYRISISSIYFKPFTPDYMDVPPEIRARNLETLDRLGEILKKYIDYDIHLEGHAVRVYWNRPNRWEIEENEELMPLSEARGNAIKKALVERGITAGRMTSEGRGGYYPVVPHGDLVNRWKNRRVEFYLVR